MTEIALPSTTCKSDVHPSSVNELVRGFHDTHMSNRNGFVVFVEFDGEDVAPESPTTTTQYSQRNEDVQLNKQGISHTSIDWG